jgi:HPt (histidine-containing phosphotransfer) domain-containing protein
LQRKRINFLRIMITDLSYLKNMTDGNPKLIREIIDIFLEQVHEYSRDMQQSYEQKNWRALSRIAHKAKSSVAIMGMHDLAEMLKELELLSREQKNVDKYPQYISRFTVECNEASEELKAIKN